MAAGEEVGEVVDGDAASPEVWGFGEFDDATGDGVEQNVMLGGAFEVRGGAGDGGEFVGGDQSCFAFGPGKKGLGLGVEPLRRI